LHNAQGITSQSLILMTIIMSSGLASVLLASPILAQTSQSQLQLQSHQMPAAEKMAEFQSATTGFIRYVKKLVLNPDSISHLTDSYVSKIKTIFGSSQSPSSSCRPNECIKLHRAQLQSNNEGNQSQEAKIKFREFRMLTSQFQKDVNQALSPANPPSIVGQLVDIYAKNVKDIFSS
jgi:hypothetical protein